MGAFWGKAYVDAAYFAQFFCFVNTQMQMQMQMLAFPTSGSAAVALCFAKGFSMFSNGFCLPLSPHTTHTAIESF